MKHAMRLLAFAFAAADLLIDLDSDRKISFAAGARPNASDGAAEGLAGFGLSDIFSLDSELAVAELLSRLSPGVRSPVIDVRLSAGDGLERSARFSAFMEPHLAPHVCCALSYQSPVVPALAPVALLDAAAFDAAAQAALARAKAAGEGVTVAFLNTPGLPAVLAQDQKGARGLLRRLEQALLRASPGGLATRIADDRYALLRPAGADPETLRTLVACAVEGAGLTPQIDQAGLPPGVDPMIGVRALRFVLDGLLTAGKPFNGAKLKSTLDGALSRTLREADEFRALTRRGEFELVYQPVVDLETRQPIQWEVLARLERNADPSAVLRMAEELSIIVEFDLAVVRAALTRNMPGPDAPRLAVNISGASLASDGFIAALIHQTAADDCRRLILEVHESAALHDLAATERKLAALKRAGFGLAWDDFGAGGMALDHLASLSVDMIKLEGGFTRRLEDDAKAVTVATHIARLCRSLGRTTVAKMVETERSRQVLTSCGIDAGQGFLFGRPSASLPTTAMGAPSARRTGFKESWG